MVGMGLERAIVYQQVGEEDQPEKDGTDSVAQHDHDATPARTQAGRAQDGIGELEIGGRHIRDANPLELEPALGCFRCLNRVQNYVTGINKEDKNEHRAEGSRNPTAKVVREEIKKQ